MRSPLRTLMGGGALFLALGNLLTAGTNVFTLDSVTLTDGGTANGSFVWDSVSETLVSWTISTTAGTQQPTPYTYSNVIAGQGQIAIGNSGIYLLGEPGSPQLNLNFTGSLDSGSLVSLLPNSREYNTYAPGFGRNVASGSVSVSQVHQFSQQGPKLVGTGAVGIAIQGLSVSLSADGNTAIVGGAADNSQAGAAWVWTRSGEVWTQQGPKLVGSGAVGSAQQGTSVSLSADGNTAIVGGNRDNGFTGAAWVWTRSGGVWTQQGPKLVGSGTVGFAQHGYTVSLSADGNTAILGGYSIDNFDFEAAWLWTRSGGVWTQQGSIRLGTVCSPSCASRATSVSLSADGNTAIVGDPLDTSETGAAWVWTRSGGVWTQQGPKLVGAGAAAGATQGMSVSLSADGNTAIVGGPSDNSQVGAAWVWTRSGGVWTQQGPKLVGSGAAGANQAFSVSLSGDGNTAVVGGPVDSYQTGATWVWTRSGGIWTQQGPKLVGSGAAGSALQGRSVSLSGDGNTAIVGGYGDSGFVGAAWIFAAGVPQEPNWVLKSPANSPMARWLPAMAYDAARGQVVLFGGYRDAFGNGNDTWVWDGTDWTQKSPSNSPPPRYGHGMTYDAGRGQMVLFGGVDSNNVIRNDTWVWDGSNWTQKSPATSPTPRAYPAMAYDSTRGQVVLFGGYRDALGASNETWVWDGMNWTQESPATSPAPRFGHGVAYDAARAQVVLFGGGWTDTWAWDGTNWTQKSPATSPTARWFHAMAYDVSRGQVVLFGGSDNNDNLNDMWAWDGMNWTKKNPLTSPPPRNSHAMVYDAAHEHVVLFGGAGDVIYNDTWVWTSNSPSATGTISVTTNLAAAAFTITGPASYAGSGTSFMLTNVPAGIYTITYGAVNCYTTPVSETKTLAAGGTLSFAPGNYQGRATITVSVAPAGATSATFSINPPVPGMPSTGPYPRTQSGVWPQSYTVAFNSVTGYTPPPSQALVPNSSCQLPFAGTYVPVVHSGMATLTVTVSPNTNLLGKFTIADAQGKVIASSVSSFGPSPQPAGKYTIKYVPLAGFYAPPDRTLVLNVGDAAIVQGKYRRLILVSFTGFGNAPSFGSGSGCGVPVPAVCEGFGVAYPDNLLSCSSRGMTNITLEARGQAAPSPSLSTSVLAPGLASRAFTFYDSFNELSPCSTPSGPPDHATAEAWLRSLNPTSDDLIAVTGHSYGGNRARLFADQLRINQVRQNASVATDALIMVDPVDWTTCDGLTVLKSFTYLVSDPSCFQTGSPREIPQGVGAFRDFTQSKALTSGIPISGYPVTMGGIIQYQFITNFTDVGHANVPFIDDTIGIDNDPRVHLFILQALTGLVRGPTPTAAIAGTPSRGSSGLNYPIRVTATPVGTATGFGTVTGVRITSASLNGVPATSMLPSSALGDIVAGSSSSVVNLVFPVSAAAKGSSVLLTVAFENSDGAPYTNTIRQVAP